MSFSRISILVMMSLLGFSVSASAQVPPPPPTSPTLWSFLGIPQGIYKLHGTMVNRRGNRPRLEKKPPLKALADVANLKSEVPAIKAAAEIKQAEDLKPQKIKAIKYLATIGCGCYDKEGKVTKALLAAMDDCTEEVRLQAIRAVMEAASSEYCSHCKQRSCCNEDIVNQLSKIAYDRDETGCFAEPSERVREAAMEAMRICCADRGGPLEIAQPQLPVESVPQSAPVEGVERSEEAERDEPPPPIAEPDSTAIPAPEPPTPAAETTVATKLASSRRNAINKQEDTDDSPVPPDEIRDVQPSSKPIEPRIFDSESDNSNRGSGPPVYKKVTGKVTRIDPSSGLVQLKLHRQATLPENTKVKVYHQVDGAAQLSAVLQITHSEPGSASARLIESSRAHKISAGETLEVWK